MQLDTHKQLLSRLGTICKHHRELSRLSGADFNVFKIVKVVHDEVRHSAFLAELLNPKGSHGQGDLFLRLFVQKLGITDFQCETAIAVVEKHIGEVTETTGGRIDILINDFNGNHIIIENKIYANDGENQLIRYYNFKKQNLYYLTLYGNDATDRSTLHNASGVKLVCGEDYKLLSYKTDILQWLEQCQKESVSMPLLREGIAHYINLIKYLTGTSSNKAMKQEIVNLLTESSTSLANANELVNNFTEAKIKLQWEFWNVLKNILLENGITIEENDKTVTKEKIRNFYQKKETPYGLWSLIYHEGEISIHWCCEIYESIHFGFTIEKNGKGGISDSYENEKYRKLLKEYDHNYESSQWFLGKQNTHPLLNFKAFNSDDIFNLADRKVLEETVQTIAEKACRDILFLQGKLAEL
jgi:hypothetical protein